MSGTLSLANATGLTFTRGDGHDDAEIRCVGSSAAVNAALDPIRYTPFPDYNSVRLGGWLPHYQSNTASARPTHYDQRST